MLPTLDQVNVLHLAGRLKDAERGYRDILVARPGELGAQHGLGVLLLQTGQARKALAHLLSAAAASPSNAEILNALGAAQLQVGDYTDAIESFKAVISQKPGHAKALANLGVALYRTNDFAASVDVLKRAQQGDPNNVDTLYNLSRAFRATGQLLDAERLGRQVLTLSPAHVQAQVDLGVTLASRGNRVGAEAKYRDALTRDPQIAEAHHNLAQVLLQSGRLAEGWQEYEWRWQTSDFSGAENFLSMPAWDRQRLTDGLLLVWAEQGPGDQILYASMLPDIERFASRVLVACTARLVPLFARSFPFAEVISLTDLSADTAKQREVSAQVPVGSLGGAMRPSMDSFSNQPAYLLPDEARAAELIEKYRTPHSDKPVIGLSWRSGNPRFGVSKSIPLTQFVNGLEGIDATFVDLQYGDTLADLEAAAGAGLEVVHDPEIDSLADLDAFAAQVAATDLVITVSNTTAHVAGALGVPCWTLVPAGSGQFWYWFLDRDDSPWYPSLRLFRQTTPGDWRDALGDLKTALLNWKPDSPG